jgi:hypothetical protein
VRAHPRAHRRILSILTASTLACGATLTVAGGPSFAATGGPTDLTTAGQACATATPGPHLSPQRLNDAQAVVLGGTYDTSAWGDGSTEDFQVWDVTEPDQPQDWTDGVSGGTVYIQLEDPSRQLDGVTYGWKVRMVNGAETSPWSDTCYYTVDRSGGAAPAVSSTEYPAGSWDNPSGGIGVAGSFTFTSAADDTVSYKYEFSDSADWQTVQPARLGGSVKVDWTPQTAGDASVSVYAIDRAGNYSDPQYYAFYVRETRPSVFSPDYQNGEGVGDLKYNVGVPGEFDFTSSVPDTASFAWHIDQDGPSGTTDADTDGKASVMIAPTKAGHQTLYVRSITRDGVQSPEQAYEFYVDNAPSVTGDLDRAVIIGSTANFHLEPRTSDVTAYVYWSVNRDSSDSTQTTIPADTDGSADLAWAADNTNEDSIGVRVEARSADGTLSEPRWLSFTVSGAAPLVTRSGGDVVGTTATITARTDMVNPTAFEAVLNNDQTTKQIVAPAANGTATFKFTVTKAQYTSVTVIARNAAGVHTDQGSTSWGVTDGPVVTSTDFPARGDGHIAPGKFTFKAQQAGATRFIYSIDGTDVSNVGVPVGANGTASVAWTPETSGYFYLHVTSQTAGGATSTETTYSFYIAADPVTVTSVSPTRVAAGGVRTITIAGSGFNKGNYVMVWMSDGSYAYGTITSVSADRRTLTAEVDLTSAATGPASVAVQPDGYNPSVTLDNALTIIVPRSVLPATRPANGTGPSASHTKAKRGSTSAAAKPTATASANGPAAVATAKPKVTGTPTVGGTRP